MRAMLFASLVSLAGRTAADPDPGSAGDAAPPEQPAVLGETPPPVETAAEETVTEKSGSPGIAPPAGSDFRPRLELFVPSARNLFSELRRSHSGVFFDHVRNLVRGMAGASAEGVDPAQADAILARVAQWPDVRLEAVTFAPDMEGRARWAVGMNWPIQDLAARLSELLGTDAAQELFEGLRIETRSAGGFALRLAGSNFAYLLPHGSDGSYLASHPDLPLDTPPFRGSEETEKDGASLLLCRLNLTGTEKDSGATVFSSFNVVTDVVYSGHVDTDGNWQESVDIHWPPISGMGVKALFGRVKQTFFVPREAFGAMVFKTMMAPGMLENMVGFGPQVSLAPGGEMEIFGEQALGPIATSVGSEMCVTVLPGNGFLPMPDIVAQLRAKRADSMMNDIAEAALALNEEYRAREQREPWHVSEVRDRKVVWSDGANRFPGMMMPLVLRPVLFTATDTDAGDKEREFLVIGWTSTSPERFVRRWLDLPRRDAEQVFLPTQKKTNGQFWINWKELYAFLSPYANLAIGSVVQDSLLPPSDDVEKDLTDASVTMRARFSGMQAHYEGPVPIGALVLPTMVTSSLAPDESGGSDLARERLAAQRLKVFYHHAKLFKDDLGRWPAELAELDGYIDFAGHPELLELQLSSSKGWSSMFDNFFGGDDEEEDDEHDVLDDEADVKIDDKLFVIEWSRKNWRLGLADGTLEHIQELYVDHEGRIHRVAKKPETEEEKKPKAGERGVMLDGRTLMQQAAGDLQRRYGLSERQH